MHIEKTRIFAVLSNETRLRCLHLLIRHGELCVCELVDACDINQPTASKALGSIKKAGLVSDRRDANWVYYQVREDLPDWVRSVLNTTVGELENDRVCMADECRYQQLVAREGEIICP